MSPCAEKGKKKKKKIQERREFVRALARMCRHTYLSASDPEFFAFFGFFAFPFMFPAFPVKQDLDSFCLCFFSPMGFFSPGPAGGASAPVRSDHLAINRP